MVAISLDYDGTFTADPELWLEFVKTAQKRGHTVVVVTMRSEEEAKLIDPRLTELVEILPTNRHAKKKFARMHGKEINIWVDDCPEFLFEDAF